MSRLVRAPLGLSTWVGLFLLQNRQVTPNPIQTSSAQIGCELACSRQLTLLFLLAQYRNGMVSGWCVRVWCQRAGREPEILPGQVRIHIA
jgi:hypothetical protein